MERFPFVAAFVAALCLHALPALSVVSRQEALSAAYPGAAIDAQRLFLTEEERQRAAELSGVEIPTALIARYLAVKGGEQIGRAYVDTHTVRTKKESLLICLDDRGRVKRIEVTAFLEPPEYLASPRWYAQYREKVLDEDLHVQRDIQPIAGATLTALATNEAVRRVLAIDRIVNAREKR